MLWLKLLRREEGQDLTEYALLIALIVIVAVVAVALLGDEISNVLSDIASTLASVI
jgi:Flp pilus assembly pilin Flp